MPKILLIKLTFILYQIINTLPIMVHVLGRKMKSIDKIIPKKKTNGLYIQLSPVQIFLQEMVAKTQFNNIAGTTAGTTS